jgi:CRP/FNR family cyclic AMP-dependent transcriptional regulator
MAGLDAIPAPLLDVIAAKGKRRHYAANAIVVNEGDASSSLYIVLSGRLKVMMSDSDGKEVILSILGPGEFFGEMGLIDDEREPARLG